MDSLSVPSVNETKVRCNSLVTCDPDGTELKLRTSQRRHLSLTATLSIDSSRRQQYKNAFKDLQIVVVFILIMVTYALTWVPVIYMTVLGIIDRVDLIPRSLQDNSIS